jgi:hypothetical protein
LWRPRDPQLIHLVCKRCPLEAKALCDYNRETPTLPVITVEGGKEMRDEQDQCEED